MLDVPSRSFDRYYEVDPWANPSALAELALHGTWAMREGLEPSDAHLEALGQITVLLDDPMSRRQLSFRGEMLAFDMSQAVVSTMDGQAATSFEGRRSYFKNLRATANAMSLIGETAVNEEESRALSHVLEKFLAITQAADQRRYRRIGAVGFGRGTWNRTTI